MKALFVRFVLLLGYTRLDISVFKIGCNILSCLMESVSTKKCTQNIHSF